MGADFTFKVCTGGDGGVGKTTMLHRYVDNKFEFDTKMTIGVEIFKKTIVIEGEIEVDLQLWDFGGQDRFRFMLDGFVMGSNGALVLFDLTKMTTFNHIEQWVELLRKHDPNLPIILIGAKDDLVDLISVKDEYAIEKAQELNLFDYLKTSAKTDHNVDKAFQELIYKMLSKEGHTFISEIKRKYDFFSGSLL